MEEIGEVRSYVPASTAFGPSLADDKVLGAGESNGIPVAGGTI